MFKKITIIMLLCLILSTNSILAADLYVWSTESKKIENDNTKTVLSSINEEVKKENSLNLTCGSAILIEQDTGKILYEHNAHEQLRPASVTKVMSILLIMEALDGGRITLDTQIPCSENASNMGGSQIWLDTTETLSVDEMLKAICVVSANDCTVAMAEYLAGSEEAFVQKMNERAKELGMNDTCFKNCHGIDEDGHVTTSYDIAVMSRELMKNHSEITKYTTIWMDSLRNGESELVNTNKLIRNYEGATGLKTGSTSLAKYNLSATATREDLNLIAVIMKAETTKLRFEEAQKLLNYGFSNFGYKKFASKGDILKEIEVAKGTEKNLNCIYSEDAGALVEKGKENDVIQEVNVKESIQAPIYKGDKVGEVTYSLNGDKIKQVDIIAEKDIEKANLWTVTTNLFNNWFRVNR